MPVTDAEGITQIIMLLPGASAARVRLSAANVVVRYLGGDLSLVREVMQNNRLQDHLEPEHPCLVPPFGIRIGFGAVGGYPLSGGPRGCPPG